MKNGAILNHFLQSPTLEISSEEFPFNNFQLYKETIYSQNFTPPLALMVGKQAEVYFEAYLNHSKNYSLLCAKLQIQGESETLGEIDYILKNLRTKEVIHVELACKFYLYDEIIGATMESKWIGPNRKDSLREKLEKIKFRQFPIIENRETIQTLKNLDIEVPTSQELCLKAFLFIPKDMRSDDFPQTFQNCIVGKWIKLEEFEKEDQSALYAIPDKKKWLLPPEQLQQWQSFSETSLEVLKQIENKRSPLIYKKTGKTIEKYFVVWW